MLFNLFNLTTPENSVAIVVYKINLFCKFIKISTKHLYYTCKIKIVIYIYVHIYFFFNVLSHKHKYAYI